MNRVLSRTLILIILPLTVASGTALGAERESNRFSAGSRPAATLDPSFGLGGVAEVPSGSAETEGSESEPRALGAAAHNGGLVVSEGNLLDLMNQQGLAGQLFGGAGSLALPAAAGRGFELTSFVVDPQGRLVLLGSSLYPEDENASPLRAGRPTFIPAELRIVRLLADGALDSSFGADGVVETDLGIPAPLSADGKRRLGAHPAAHPTGIAMGPSGELVVTGDAVVRLGRDCVAKSIPPAIVKAGFVAKFNENGSLDPTFGKGGLVGGRHLRELPLGGEVVTEPVVSSTQVITYRSTATYACAENRSQYGIAQLTSAGQARTSFGQSGASAGRYVALASATNGSVFAVTPGPRRKGQSVTSKISKFGPGGRRVESFGKHGFGLVRLGPEPFLDALAIDSRGRIVVSGTTGLGASRSMVLVRLTASGNEQMSFGPGGRIIDRVPGLADSSSLFFDPEGRLIAVHAGLPSKGLGLVVARYLLSD